MRAMVLEAPRRPLVLRELPEPEPGPGQVRDMNAPTLAALVREAGGEPAVEGILPDDRPVVEARLRQAQAASVLISFHATRGAAVNLYLPKARSTPLAQNAERLLLTAPQAQAALLKVYAGSPHRLAEALEKAFSALGIVVAKAEGPYALTDIPGAAVVLEVGTERLKDPKAREELAQAVAQAVQAYLEAP
uniref:MoaB/Mog domain-containing protein n=1 Tax=Thermus islandicus TaxID=540988 RepID=A0A7C2GGA3_9DEIN